MSYRESLHQEGRPAAGGFPGTMAEARELLARSLPAELARQGMRLPSFHEREQSARALYASARQQWLAHREPEAP